MFVLVSNAVSASPIALRCMLNLERRSSASARIPEIAWLTRATPTTANAGFRRRNYYGGSEGVRLVLWWRSLFYSLRFVAYYKKASVYQGLSFAGVGPLYPLAGLRLQRSLVRQPREVEPKQAFYCMRVSTFFSEQRPCISLAPCLINKRS